MTVFARMLLTKMVLTKTTVPLKECIEFDGGTADNNDTDSDADDDGTGEHEDENKSNDPSGDNLSEFIKLRIAPVMFGSGSNIPAAGELIYATSKYVIINNCLASISSCHQQA